MLVARNCPFFAMLDAASVNLLDAGSQRVVFERGQVLFLRGDAAGATILIAEGLVRLFVTDLDGTETTIRILGDSDLVGQLAVIDNGTLAASAIALRKTIAYRIPAKPWPPSYPSQVP